MNGIVFSINRASVDAIANHIDSVRERIRVGIRLGMRDGLRGLAQAEVEAVSGHDHTGRLARILGQGGRVIDTGDTISAVYRPRSPGLQLHYWLEYGTRNPAVEDKLMRMPWGYRMGRKAFQTAGQPYFFTTAEVFRGRFFEIVSARVREAIQA
jgi:hypothetical protein